MIAPRLERIGLSAAKPVLIVGMAKSKNNPEFVGPSFERLADYCGAPLSQLHEAFDFVNLVDGHPGRSDGGKYDKPPDLHEWKQVGQRASLLYADLLERPRKHVVGLGGFVRDALSYWWPKDSGSSDTLSLWFVADVGPSRCALHWSPHPSGVSTWWNDPANLTSGREFWTTMLQIAQRSFPLSPKQVSLGVRTAWTRHALAALGSQWPSACVDWPFVVPNGRPVALFQGASIPAAQLALELHVAPRPGPEQQALHSCDRGLHCINPGHLRWGSELENRLDQDERSRGTIGKIGMEGAREIKQQMDELAKRIARERGVSTAAVYGIAAGKTWNPNKWS